MKSTLERLRDILNSRTFNWESDEVTLREALHELQRLEWVRESHRESMKRLDALIEERQA